MTNDPQWEQNKQPLNADGQPIGETHTGYHYHQTGATDDGLTVLAPCMKNHSQRDDLYRRLLEADADAKDKHAGALQASRDRGALIDALTRDGASLREIAVMLGSSHQAVDKLLRRYRDSVKQEA